MKKLIITAAIVLVLGLTSFADPNGGGLFQRGAQPQGMLRTPGDNMPALPNHGSSNNEDAPIGTGIAVLTALGAAYLAGKRRREE